MPIENKNSELVYYYSLSRSLLITFGALIFAVILGYMFFTNAQVAMGGISFWVVIAFLIYSTIRDVVVNKMKSKYALLSFITLVILIFIHFYFGTRPVALIGVLFFGFGGVFYFWSTVINKKFVFKLSELGLEIRRFPIGENFKLGWDNIEKIESQIISGQKLLSFYSKVGEQNKQVRSVPINGLNAKPDQVISDIKMLAAQKNVPFLGK